MAKLIVLAWLRVSRSTLPNSSCGGQTVDVLARAERLLELRHVGHVRGEPKLDLAVIGAQQDMSRIGDEGVADLAPDLGPDRDVLQIGIVRRQPPGLRPGQREAGVDPAGLGIDLRLQRVGVGRAQLGQLAPVEHQARAIDPFGRQPLELVDVGRIGPALALAPALEAEPLVQHLAELLGLPIVNGPHAAS